MASPSHAGGIVFRRTNDDVHYLVVEASTNAAHWVFPKGHIERDEKPEEAALREVREESGVRAAIVSPVEVVEFVGPHGRVTAAYYLMEYLGEEAAQEERRIVWCSYEEALARLTFGDTRTSLAKAHFLVRERKA